MSEDVPAAKRWSPAATPADSSRVATLSERATPVVVLAVLPWIMLAISRDWIYSETGLIDAWLYHGYFHRFPEFASTFFRQTYYGTRLAWILPGYAAYSLLPPYVANLTLHLTFYYAAVAALYRATAILTTRSAALISAAAFGTTMPVIVAMGWDYVDGAVITYTLVALWAVIEASIRCRRAPFLAVAGAAAACIVHSNLAAVLLGPTLLIAYWYAHPEKRWSDVGIFVCGGLIATAVLGIVSAVAGGLFLFFMPSVRWAGAALGTQTFVPVPPLQWPGSARFIVPLVGMIAAIGAFASRRTPATRTALVMLLWLAAAFLAFDEIFSGGLLQIQYYVSWFLPLAFFGVAAAMAPARLSLPTSATLSIGLVLVQASALAGVPSTLHQALARRLGSTLPAVEIALAGTALLIILAVSWRPPRSAQAIVIAAALVVADFVVAPNLSFVPAAQGQSQFQAVQQTLRFIRSYVPHGSRPLFWIAQGSRNSSYFASLASTHLYLYSLISTVYPRLPDDTGQNPRPGASVAAGDYVVVAADTEADPQGVEHELQRFGLHGKIVVSEPVRTERASFVLTLLRISG